MFYETQPSVIIENYPNQKNNYLSFCSMKNIIKLLPYKVAKNMQLKGVRKHYSLGVSELLNRMYYIRFPDFVMFVLFVSL